MLDRLQQMLETLQAGIQPQMGQQGSQAQKMMNDMMRMQQKQSDLLQQSFRMQRGQQQGQAGLNRGPGQRDPMDPFGRTAPREDSAGGNSGNTTGVKVPDQSELERARQIFEELRDRRNDPTRPRDERDYLDRLLKQF